MPQGLQIFDSSGNIILDVTNRLTRLIGMEPTFQVSNSVFIPEIGTEGEGWFCIDNYRRDLEPPYVYFDGQYLNWTYSYPNPSLRAPCIIIYGVY